VARLVAPGGKVPLPHYAKIFKSIPTPTWFQP
jgi:hypothetical protein